MGMILVVIMNVGTLMMAMMVMLMMVMMVVLMMMVMMMRMMQLPLRHILGLSVRLWPCLCVCGCVCVCAGVSVCMSVCLFVWIWVPSRPAVSAAPPDSRSAEGQRPAAIRFSSGSAPCPCYGLRVPEGQRPAAIRFSSGSAPCPCYGLRVPAYRGITLCHPETDVEFPVGGSGYVTSVFPANDVKYLAAPGSPGPDRPGVLNRRCRHVWGATARGRPGGRLWSWCRVPWATCESPTV